MKFMLLITWLMSVVCFGVQTESSAELVRPILEASTKPFPEFVRVTINVSVSPMVLPKTDTLNQPMAAVSALIWKRLSTLDMVINATNTNEKVAVLHSMGLLREWLLKHDDYTSLLLASYVEEKVSIAALAALSENHITPEVARQLVGELKKSVSVDSILSLAERSAPKSAKILDIRKADANFASMLTISAILSDDLAELVDTRIAKLMEQERPASLTFYVAYASQTKPLAGVLIEYASKGGNVNLSYEKLAVELPKIIPDVVGKTVPGIGLKIEAAMFAALMDNVRKWKSRH